jgi:hypothetical protein
MPTPTNLGTLNRLLASVLVPALPELNITSQFCTRDQFTLGFEGETTQSLPQMTGVVQSPEPYQMAVITAHVLKTNGLGQLYESQRQLTALIGDVTAIPDTPGLAPYQLSNCAIANCAPAIFNGTDAGYVVTIRGTFYINNNLWQ